MTKPKPIVFESPCKITVCPRDAEAEAEETGFAEANKHGNFMERLKAHLDESLGDHGLEEYLDEPVRSKVEKVELEFFPRGLLLWLRATVRLKKALTRKEADVLADDLIGQYSDGWGEGFEQFPVCTIRARYQVPTSRIAETPEYEPEDREGELEVCVHPWFDGRGGSGLFAMHRVKDKAA